MALSLSEARGASLTVESPPPADNTYTYNRVTASDASQAYLIYGSMVYANATASQTIAPATITQNAGTGTSSASVTTASTNGFGSGIGANTGVVVQYSNSATAYAIGGGTVGN